MTTLFDGITARRVSAGRLQANVLERTPAPEQTVAPEQTATIAFIHGNVSSSSFWQPVMLMLPSHLRVLAIDLRGFGDSETLPVDATRGLADYSDDVAAVLDALEVDRVHLVGWSMGGGVVMRYLIDHPQQVASLTLVSPVSPFGFGGTGGIDGRMLTTDAAGCGAGGANPDFIARIVAEDRTDAAPTSPRSVFRSSYVAEGYQSEHEDLWVESMLTTAIGEGNYPGDSVASESWPGFAAGKAGVLNTMAPQYFNASGIVDIADKPPVLWIRGVADVIVSDTSLFDLNYLGQLGVIPGWPGAETAPPQPMIAQTRAVLDAYRDAGGQVTELALQDCGHSPHLEHPDRFVAAVVEQLGLGQRN
ncbi:alpha/beta hydrolase [Parafrigoribacterium mesophilum]|uniref:alpha/beta hydrolase n=1 Tax=Parafrigoribacterium mesophilum TaxID=433646 RepID=UPI0031FE130F